MKLYKHKKIDESFSDVFDSSLVDYSKDFEKKDDQYKRNQIIEWMHNNVFNFYTVSGDPLNPNRRWNINDNYEIPFIDGRITFNFIKIVNHRYIGTGLTEKGEIPDYIKIGKITHFLHINNREGIAFDSALTSFKNFPKYVKWKLIFDSTEDLQTLKDIPIIDLRHINDDGSYSRNGEIDFHGSCESISRSKPENLFKEILLYCDYIKGTNYGEDQLYIKFNTGYQYFDTQYTNYGYLRKLPYSGKKYFDIEKYTNTFRGIEKRLIHFTLDDGGNLIEDNDW